MINFAHIGLGLLGHLIDMQHHHATKMIKFSHIGVGLLGHLSGTQHHHATKSST